VTCATAAPGAASRSTASALARVVLRRVPGGTNMLDYTLTFLLDRSADVAWVVLSIFFVLTLLAAMAHVIDGINHL
jgi:hypothetical protein